MEQFLFPLPEIEEIILSYLDKLVDYKKLMLVNKYYHSMVSHDSVYVELLRFCKKIHKSGIFVPGRAREARPVPSNLSDKTSNVLDAIFTKMCDENYLQLSKYYYGKYQNKINIREISTNIF